MTKYKLEYIWLDGYSRRPTCAARRRSRNSLRSRRSRSCRCGALTAARPAGRRPATSDCVLKPVACYPDPARTNGALVMCEVMMPDGVTPHPPTAARPSSTIPTRWFGFEQEYFFYKDGRPLGFPRERLSGAAGPVLHRRRLQERRRRRARDRRGASRPLPRGRHQPRGHQRRGREGPVGIPDLRQGLQEGRRRDVDRPLPDASPHENVRHRHRTSTASRSADTDWNGSGMHANFSTKYMREVGGKEYFEALMDGVREEPRRAHRRLRSRQPPAADRPARDRSRSTSSATASPTAAPRSACRTASSTTATRATSKTAVRTRRATRTRSPRRF